MLDMVIGALVGLLLSMLASLFITPVFADRAKSFLVRRFGAGRESQRIGGYWRIKWRIDGDDTWRGIDRAPAVIRQLGDRVSGRFQWGDRKFQIDGKIDRDMYLTGTWQDKIEGVSHHGVFQLVIHLHALKMKGRWLGFSIQNNAINSGDWEWLRVGSEADPGTGEQLTAR
jgi:hypothetical protein